MTKPEANGTAVDVKASLATADMTSPALRLVQTKAAATPSRAGRNGDLHDLSRSALYLNRELSWLRFNRRVLKEADDRRTPLLERIKFLAIASGNLDEFYMKRIGGLKQQVGAGVTRLTVDGRTPRQQLSQCAAELACFQREKNRVFVELMDELARNGIVIHDCGELTAQERDGIRRGFKENILPLMTPLAIDSAHPFPFISNLSLNLLIALGHSSSDRPLLARVKIPVSKDVPRFMKLAGGHRFVLIEDVLKNNLDLLFPGLEVQSSALFRVIRNAASGQYGKGADDLLEMIESELRSRKFAPVVRLETSVGIDPVQRAMLAKELGLDEAEDVSAGDALIGMSDLMALAGLNIPALHDAPHQPVDHPALPCRRGIFESIREAGSILLQHPYESFVTSVERFVREASSDPQVVAIKMTLYRTSADTKIVEHLVEAAQNGKQVAVLVELKARFDEAANIKWASRLEEAGIHVNYGVLGLKTHCKTILVVRREGKGLRRYAHIGSGNYHAGTARLYSDVGLLTCDENLTNDLTELFNHLTTGWGASRSYGRILTAPLTIKKALLAKIEREIAQHSAESPGLIRLKTNALEDSDITAALYRASQAGVKVELLVRDICRLRPGIPGLSENISVISVVGRFLEHSRIYYFRNGAAEEFYIGSADLMTRNLERRVEVIVPVEDILARRLLREALQGQLEDCRNIWDMDAQGNYRQRRPAPGAGQSGCQEAAILAAATRSAPRRPLASGEQADPIRIPPCGFRASQRVRGRNNV